MNFFQPIKHTASMLIALFVAASFASFSIAGPGHDHGDEAPVATGPTSPRFETHSDLFELVGIYEKEGITLYLDRFTTNEPITNSRVEFEAAGVKGIAAAQPDGTYRIVFDALKTAKENIAFSFTITQANEADLLAADLVLAQAGAEGDGHDHGHSHGINDLPKWFFVLLAVLFLGISAVIAVFVIRKKSSIAPT
jgi:membrane fusion protein, heavy metal efflux system